MSDPAGNKAIIERFWDDLGRRDWEAIGPYFTEDAHYIDVPVLNVEEGAYGPERIKARLRLGLEPLVRYEPLPPSAMVAEGNVVITEHSELWEWESGEQIVLPFVSVQEFRGDLISRWWDYWDLSVITNAAPTWWIERLAGGY
jgi:limonene-1,2-epoxide hydrolase